VKASEVPDPVEFHVTESVFLEADGRLLIAGEVPAGAAVEAGMKASLAVNRSFALELSMDRVEWVETRGDRAAIAVWIEARSEAEASLLSGLEIGNECLLVWERHEPVDPWRHFVSSDGYAEVCIDVRPLSWGRRLCPR